MGLRVFMLTFTLLWQFPRAYQPAPSAFVIISTNAAGNAFDTMQTLPSAAGACVALDGAVTLDTFCTDWPGCPPPGIIAFFVAATWGEDQSPPSNLLTCVFDQSAPCVCHPTDTYVPPPVNVHPPVVLPPMPPGEIPPPGHLPLPPLPVFAPVFPPAPT